MTPPRILVLGCGVVGLTTAVVLREAGYPVEVLGAEPPEHTTSIVAGATWFPYKVDPPELVIRWAAESRPVFEQLGLRDDTGVLVRECVQFWRDTAAHPPWWAGAVPDLRELPVEALPDGFLDSYLFSQPVIDMTVYLPYLCQRLRAAGGTIAVRRLDSLCQAGSLADVVVNCTGLAARELTGDEALYPVRGQWVRVRNPGIDRVLADFDHPDGDAYIIPHPDSCILGGSAEIDEWDTTVNLDLARRIIERCAGLDARVADAEVLQHQVGLRPGRSTGVRVQLQTLPDGTVCVHNYGHGGAGVTLSWGCAWEVLRLLQAADGEGARA